MSRTGSGLAAASAAFTASWRAVSMVCWWLAKYAFVISRGVGVGAGVAVGRHENSKFALARRWNYLKSSSAAHANDAHSFR